MGNQKSVKPKGSLGRLDNHLQTPATTGSPKNPAKEALNTTQIAVLITIASMTGAIYGPEYAAMLGVLMFISCIHVNYQYAQNRLRSAAAVKKRG